MKGYRSHPLRRAAWLAYKPIPEVDFDRWLLGVGPLPGARICPHDRLVYLVVQEGKTVAIRGRAFRPTCRTGCPKWLSAPGSVAALWGWDHLTRAGCKGKALWVVENPVDAMLLMSTVPGLVACATTAGAGAWREPWTERIAAAARRAEEVTVCYDNDPAGLAGAALVFDALWPGVGRKLRRHAWPPGTPEHADAGWWQGGGAAPRDH
jgi:hypothetical protein